MDVNFYISFSLNKYVCGSCPLCHQQSDEIKGNNMGVVSSPQQFVAYTGKPVSEQYLKQCQSPDTLLYSNTVLAGNTLTLMTHNTKYFFLHVTTLIFLQWSDDYQMNSDMRTQKMNT